MSDPEGDPFAVTIDGIWQDEPVNNTGDGSTVPDGLGIGKPHARVRAERDGAGNGRVYHIYFSGADAYGSCSGELLVGVPKSTKLVAVDEGPLFDSTVE